MELAERRTAPADKSSMASPRRQVLCCVPMPEVYLTMQLSGKVYSHDLGIKELACISCVAVRAPALASAEPLQPIEQAAVHKNVTILKST